MTLLSFYRKQNVYARDSISSTNKGDTVLDPFMGSGTVAVACYKLERNFIGMEIDPVFLEIARQRIEKLELQPDLPLEF